MIIFGLVEWKFFVVLAASVYIFCYLMIKVMGWHTDRL
jgi:hypothetical protein